VISRKNKIFAFERIFSHMVHDANKVSSVALVDSILAFSKASASKFQEEIEEKRIPISSFSLVLKADISSLSILRCEGDPNRNSSLPF